MNRLSGKNKLIIVVLISIGAYLLFFASNFWIDYAKRCDTEVSATVISVQNSNGYIATYEYTLGKNQYKNKAKIAAQDPVKTGDVVKLMVNKDKPDEFCDPAMLGLLPASKNLYRMPGIICLAMAALIFMTNRKQPDDNRLPMPEVETEEGDID